MLLGTGSTHLWNSTGAMNTILPSAWLLMMPKIDVLLGCDLVTVKDIVYDLHHIHPHHTIQSSFSPVDGGGIILEETTPDRNVSSREKVISQKNIVLICNNVLL